MSASYFYREFKDRAVLVNVDHSTGELEHLPKAAADAFHSPAEGGFAPCLCLTDPSGTRLIGMIPLWNNPVEREMLFNQYRGGHRGPGALGRGRETSDGRGCRRRAPVRRRPWHPLPRRRLRHRARPAPTPPARTSSSFARELEITRQAERQQAVKAAPSP